MGFEADGDLPIHQDIQPFCAVILLEYRGALRKVFLLEASGQQFNTFRMKALKQGDF
jgi:hypothetical protein